MLQRIKFCMAEGITVVLVHCEPLFESLYDLLNQHYTEYGNQLFVRLAFGSASRLCPIARGFRVVVVVEKVDAYTYLAPPLLNRFEKQVIEWRDMVPDAVAGVLPTLRRFVSILCGQDGDAPLDHRRARRIICGFHHETLSSLVTSLWQQQLERRQQRLHRRRGAKGQEAKPLAEGEGGRQQAGQHTAHTQEQPGDEEEAPGERRPRKPEVEAEASQSVAHRSADGPHHSAPQDAVQARPQDQAQDSQLAAADDTEGNTLELLNEAFHRLIWLCTPEAVCRILHGPCAARLEKEFAIDMRAIYFQAQAHSSVPDLVERHLQPWSDEDAAGGGEQLFLLTHSPLTNALLPQLEGLVLDADAADAGPPLRTRSVALHELSSAEDLTALLQEVYEPTLAGDGAPQLLVLSCDLLATSVRRIRHVQHLVGTFHERHRAAVKQQMEEAARTAAAAAAAEALKARKGHAESSGNSAAPEHAAGGSGDPPPREPPPHTSDEQAVAPHHQQAYVQQQAQLVQRQHVVLLLHLQRDADAGVHVDFLRGWRYAYLDNALRVAETGLPQVEALLGQSMQELLQSQTDAAALMQVSCRSALAMVSFPHERSNDDVRALITRVLHCLTNPAFTHAVHDAMLGLLARWGQAHQPLNSPELLSDEALASAGTFASAVHRRVQDVVARMLATALAFMERNGGLASLTPELEPLWLSLFSDAFRAAESSAALAKWSLESRGSVDVVSDGSGGAWQAKFPFSFFVSDLVESLRTAADTGAPPKQQRTLLLQQWRLVSPLSPALLVAGGSDSGAAEDQLPPQLLESYVSDFVQIHTPPVPALSTPQCTQLVKATLCLAVPPGEQVAPPDTIPEVHLRFWNCEVVLRAYVHLAVAVPTCAEPLIALLSAESAPLSAATHTRVLHCVVSALAPTCAEAQGAGGSGASGQGMVGGGDGYVRWMEELLLARAPLSVLLDRCEPGERGGFEHALEKLQLWHTFVSGVALPLAVPQVWAAQLWTALSSGDLRAAATFEAVLRALATLLEPSALEAAQASSFVQTLVLEWLLGATPTTDPGLVRLLVRLFAGAAAELQTALTGCLAHQYELLRVLLSLSEPSLRAVSFDELRSCICAEAAQRLTLDGPLCACYVTVLSTEAGCTHIDETLQSNEDFSPLPPLLACVQGLEANEAAAKEGAAVLAALHGAARCRRLLRCCNAHQATTICLTPSNPPNPPPTHYPRRRRRRHTAPPQQHSCKQHVHTHSLCLCTQTFAHMHSIETISPTTSQLPAAHTRWHCGSSALHTVRTVCAEQLGRRRRCCCCPLMPHPPMRGWCEGCECLCSSWWSALTALGQSGGSSATEVLWDGYCSGARAVTARCSALQERAACQSTTRSTS